MKIKLQDKYIGYLSKQPEQGMGYQVVDVTLRDGRVLKNRLVFNSSDLKLYEGERLVPDDIVDVTLNTH